MTRKTEIVGWSVAVAGLIALLLFLIYSSPARGQELNIYAGYNDSEDLGYEAGPLAGIEGMVGDQYQLRIGATYFDTPKSYTQTDTGYAYNAYATAAAYLRFGLGLAGTYRYSGWEADEKDGSRSSKSGDSFYLGPSFRWDGGFVEIMTDGDDAVGELRWDFAKGVWGGARIGYDDEYGETYSILVGYRIGGKK